MYHFVVFCYEHVSEHLTSYDEAIRYLQIKHTCVYELKGDDKEKTCLGVLKS